METKKLAEQIFSEIQGRQTSTTSILREARTLGKLIGNGEFDWVEKELKGYVLEDGILPTYRNANAIESRTWVGHLDTTVQKIYSDWLGQKAWVKWYLYQSVTVLEDLQSNGGYTVNTGVIYKNLEFSGKSMPIYKSISIDVQEIKKILDQIQDKVSEQISDVLTKPQITKPSHAILEIYSDKFPETKSDIGMVAHYLETGEDYLLATRSCRPILHAIIRALNIEIPAEYVFSDGVKVSNTGEKSKIKYYLECKGKTLHKDKLKLMSLDNIFREIYEISSRADKNTVSIYEANFCIDTFLRFLERFYRYTDLLKLN